MDDVDRHVPHSLGLPRRPEHFDALYAHGTPPWDIGRPQPAFLELLAAGRVTGPVLDAGCGTGEHALMAAAAGLDATGVDASPLAVGRAREKALARDLDVRFLLGDATDLPARLTGGDRPLAPGQRFGTVLDCGLLHVLDDADRDGYLASLAAVTAPGGRYAVLCFSDAVPGDVGPRRTGRDELAGLFGDGWRVEELRASAIDVVTSPPGVPAWLAVVRRLG